MSLPKYTYQAVPVNYKALTKGVPSTRGQAVAAGVKLFQKSSIALNRYAVSRRIEKEIDKIHPQIEEAMSTYENKIRQNRPDTGVLVVVGISEFQDPTGARLQSFLGIHIGGAGSDYASVLKRYQNTPRLVQGAAKGSRRIDKYFWVTRTQAML